MALTRKNLYFGQLAGAKADIYSPSSADGLIHNILLHNINTTTETVEINYHDGSNEYVLYNLDLATNETLQLSFIGEGLYIEDAGKLTGHSTTASKVTIKIDGTEET